MKKSHFAIGLGTFFVGSMLWVSHNIQESHHHKIVYERAYEYATQIYGNGAVMNEEGFNKWYDAMQVDRRDEPKTEDLERFVNGLIDQQILPKLRKKPQQ